MQKDMHYFGTYAIARAAGIKPEDAQVIASAAQFVDDNSTIKKIDFEDKGSLNSRPTAHGKLGAWKNMFPRFQREVWIPFHFLPGGSGEDFLSKIECQQDSDIAKEMVQNHLNHNDDDIYKQLLGITAHVYADTFSHYGFSGLSSNKNDIDVESIKLSKSTNDKYITSISKRSQLKKQGLRAGRAVSRCLGKTLGQIAECISNDLGHGGVYTYPDAPFLEWSFNFEDGRPSNRKNSESFLLGCEALYKMFRESCIIKPELYAGNHKDFTQIKASLKDILEFNGDEDERIKNWKDKFSNESANFTEVSESFRNYLGDSWNKERTKLDNSANSTQLLKSNVFNFYKAASYHRHYVLRDLLPEHGIVVF
ncbi:DUF6765 family protein [Maridesulfovibrio frigidus]|uniref:DUF6765 family protein n=1 Tax=Maridesulfovibrio frigidus TaxID=340956 RepID=UPI0004E269D3|nr:DUF6765 family protein [Maridesulfovibrio frigidus]